MSSNESKPVSERATVERRLLISYDRLVSEVLGVLEKKNGKTTKELYDLGIDLALQNDLRGGFLAVDDDNNDDWVSELAMLLYSMVSVNYKSNRLFLTFTSLGTSERLSFYIHSKRNAKVVLERLRPALSKALESDSSFRLCVFPVPKHLVFDLQEEDYRSISLLVPVFLEKLLSILETSDNKLIKASFTSVLTTVLYTLLADYSFSYYDNLNKLENSLRSIMPTDVANSLFLLFGLSGYLSSVYDLEDMILALSYSDGSMNSFSLDRSLLNYDRSAYAISNITKLLNQYCEKLKAGALLEEVGFVSRVDGKMYKEMTYKYFTKEW